jgi:hypothetical protein
MRVLRHLILQIENFTNQHTKSCRAEQPKQNCNEFARKPTVEPHYPCFKMLRTGNSKHACCGLRLGKTIFVAKRLLE